MTTAEPSDASVGSGVGRVRAPPAPVVRYGLHPDQVANLHLPAAEDGPWPCVVLVHGGFWRDRWDRTPMTPLALDLAARGYAAWNVEYRRVGQEGGGWPGTLDDVAAAVDALADVTEVDSGRVVAVGHSAGGHLALCLCSRDRAVVKPRAAVSLAGLTDLARARSEGLGDGAIDDFLGGRGNSADLSERLRAASPLELLPRVPQLLVHGSTDNHVPQSQCLPYAERARAAGIDVELVEVDGADHFDVIDPRHRAWQVVVEALPRLVVENRVDARA